MRRIIHFIAEDDKWITKSAPTSFHIKVQCISCLRWESYMQYLKPTLPQIMCFQVTVKNTRNSYFHNSVTQERSLLEMNMMITECATYSKLYLGTEIPLAFPVLLLWLPYPSRRNRGYCYNTFLMAQRRNIVSWSNRQQVTISLVDSTLHEINLQIIRNQTSCEDISAIAFSYADA